MKEFISKYLFSTVTIASNCKKIQFKHLIVLLALLFCITLFPDDSNAQSYANRTYDENDGLPSLEIHDIQIDSNNMIWIVTRNGIASYDGDKWDSYYFPQSLPHHEYQKLAITKDGKIFVISRFFELAEFVDNKWVDRSSEFSPMHNNSFIQDFFITQWDGAERLIVNDRATGLVISDGHDWKKIEGSRPEDDFTIFSLIQYDDKLIAAGIGGLLIVSPEKVEKLTTKDINLPNNNVYGVERIKDYEGEGFGLWLTGNNWLARYENGDITVLDNDTRVKQLDEFKKQELYDAGSNGLIFGNTDRVYRLFPSGEITNLNMETGLISDGITGIIQDHEGNYWISGKRGLTKIFSLQILNSYTTNGLLENEVAAINQYDDGTFIFGHNRGLTFLKDGKFRYIDIPDDNYRVRIMDIEKDHNGNMWICASRAGVAKILDNGNLKWYTSSETNKQVSFICMLFDKDNNPVFGTNHGFYNLENNQLVQSVILPADIETRNMIIDSKGAIYFTNKYVGLGVYYDGNYDTYEPVLQTMSQIFSIYKTKDNKILVGTKGGLGIVQNDEIIPYPINDRYIENSVYFINEDKVGNLWIGTDQGVFIWDNIRLEQYKPTNGLSGLETNRAAGFCADNGDFYVGTSSGLSRFIYRKAKDKFSIPDPDIEITGIQFDGIDYASGNNHKINYGTDIILKYRMISYMEGKDKLYKLKFRKNNGLIIDEFTVSSGLYHFINPSPGKYILSVSGRRADGVWSDEKSTGIIYVMPPFYARLPFILSTLLLFIGILLIFTQQIVKRKVTEYEKKIKQSKNDVKEEHDPSFELLGQRANFGIISLLANGTISKVNTTLCKILGYEDKDTVMEKNFFMNILEQYIDRDNLIETIDENNVFSGFQTSLRKKDGSFIYVSLSGKVTRDNNNTIQKIEAIVEDISDKEQVLNEIKRLAHVVEQSAEYIFITDVKGKLIYLNPSFAKRTGFKSSDVLERDAILYKDNEQDEHFYRNILKTVISGNVWKGSIKSTDVHGNRLYLDTVISPLKDMYDKVTHVVSTSRDMTRQVELEKQLFQAQKMEAFGQLAGGVAHDFNNIVQAIVGFTDLALLDEKMQKQTSEMLEEIRLASGRASSLITRLLSFSKREEFDRNLYDINKIISEMLEMLSRLLGENIEISKIFIDRELIIDGDRNQIEQILLNLIVNARDAIGDSENGNIKIKTGLAHFFEENLPAVKNIKAGKYAYFVVEDNGCGIPAQDIEHIYDPFFSSKKDRGGTGLGLSIVYNIINQHNGFINLDSHVGDGTKFTVYLPLKEGSSSIGNEVKDDEKDVKGNGTILFAEDDEQVRNLAENILEYAGYTVITAIDGEDTINKYEQNQDKIDLVIIDVIMPKKNGKQVFDFIKEKDANQKMWFISGYSETIIKSSFLPGEEVEFLRKPFAPRELLTRIKNSITGV